MICQCSKPYNDAFNLVEDPAFHTFFFGKNRFNLAKGLKATQVHYSDTPSLSHGDWWGGWAVNHVRKSKKHVDIVDTSDARPRGLWVFG